MTEAAAKTRRQKVEQKERAILTATRAVFREKGAEEAKISAIAQAAGLAEGTVYLYFKNKQALLMAAVSDFYAELTRDAESAVAQSLDTGSQVLSLARLHFGRVFDEWPLIAEAMGPYLPSPEYRETEAFALNRRYVGVFDGIMRSGVARGDIRADLSIPAMRDAFYGGLEHCARSARLRTTTPDIDAEVRQFLTIFMAGVMGRPSHGEIDGARVVRRLQSVIVDIEEQMRSADTDREQT